jgi:hypothetical protein
VYGGQSSLSRATLLALFILLLTGLAGGALVGAL